MTRDTGKRAAAPRRTAASKPTPTPKPASTPPTVTAALAALKGASTRKDYANLARFGIAAPRAFGVSIANVQKLARRYGRDHEFAAALWASGWYEARLLAAYVDDPAAVTPAQMDRWCRDFDNWGICDTVCFVLFDRSPHAWPKVDAWSGEPDEFVKRAAFALLASLAGHDKLAADRQFIRGLALVEAAASDDRNFVKKGVSWALRRIGTRNPALHAAALKTARRLAASDAPAARWVGNDGVRDLTKTRAPRQQKPAKVAKPAAGRSRT
jgi:3-methyladenine DNA glycosylase AlkD